MSALETIIIAAMFFASGWLLGVSDGDLNARKRR